MINNNASSRERSLHHCGVVNQEDDNSGNVGWDDDREVTWDETRGDGETWRQVGHDLETAGDYREEKGDYIESHCKSRKDQLLERGQSRKSKLDEDFMKLQTERFLARSSTSRRHSYATTDR